MSGYNNPRSQENYISGDESAGPSSNTTNEGYVDFNQFLLQHNLSGIHLSDYYSYPNNQLPYMPNIDYNVFQPQNQFQNDIAATSNLLPTAAEFVPRLNCTNLNDNETFVMPTTTSATNNVVHSAQYYNNVEDFKGSSNEQQPSRNHGNNTGAISKTSLNQQNNESRENHEPRENHSYGNGYYSNISNNTRNGRYDNNRNNRRKDHWRSNYRERDWNESRHSYRARNFDQYVGEGDGETASNHSNEKQNDEDNEKYTQREKLVREIETRKLECLVCVEQIKSHQSIWSCSNCFHILHLNCIIKWASSSKAADGWRCPACQNITLKVPRDYYCFCGKTKNPHYNRNDLAHTCGEVCGRKELCVHPCTLLCHPGPCPPCQANVTRECGCGKMSKTMQCCIKEDLQCENKCGKLLNCELHTCDKDCHMGKCPNCDQKVDQKCHCEKLERQVTCTRETLEKKRFSCGKTCSKPLPCGNHICKDSCHSGDCRTCKLTPQMITSCPCGKMEILAGQRKSCLDPVPVCSGVCGRTLRCGLPSNPHHCMSKCHTGNCPPCNKQTAVKCRCGHMDQMIKCRQLATRADDARCKKRCTKKRNCGKHKCNQECCIDIDHICPMPCNHNLSCGKHKCDQTCHRGNCQQCYRSSFDELYCECGANVIYPPVPCGTKRPVCDKPCSRRHPCGHPVKHNCHSGPNCPPCMMFTTKACFGNHEQRKTIPCIQESYSCGLPCNKDLRCGRHKCIKPCHEGICQTEIEICKQNCMKTRQICGHKCNAPCHNGDCPETPCKENVEVTCECGNRKQMRTCHDFSSDYRRIATAQLATSMMEMQRGNMVELSDIMGPIKMTNNKTLECNEECKVLERNRRLAVGLQTRTTEVPSKALTRYSDFIRDWYKKDANLVKMIHEKLTELVKLSKDSKQRSRSHSFPTMNRDKRQLVHEMCGMFGVDSVAYDAEPNRNVVATAYKDRAWFPAMSIMEIMQRESGQRRVPVPNNNAWGMKR